MFACYLWNIVLCKHTISCRKVTKKNFFKLVFLQKKPFEKCFYAILPYKRSTFCKKHFPKDVFLSKNNLSKSVS